MDEIHCFWCVMGAGPLIAMYKKITDRQVQGKMVPTRVITWVLCRWP